MKVSKETEQKILQLQLIEQTMQNILLQKQTFQTQLTEIENALEELKGTKDDAYKIVGNIMIKSKKQELVKDLNSKKEIVSLRIKNLEKQETKLKEKASPMQKEIMKELEGENE
jgi:prefoldin beta subunit